MHVITIEVMGASDWIPRQLFIGMATQLMVQELEKGYGTAIFSYVCTVNLDRHVDNLFNIQVSLTERGEQLRGLKWIFILIREDMIRYLESRPWLHAGDLCIRGGDNDAE